MIDIAFALLRGALLGEEPRLGAKPVETSTWWGLFKLLQHNHVEALAGMAVERLDVPREVKVPWLAEREKAAEWFRYQTGVQNDIVATMKEHGIATLVLKGTHTAQYYPKPELREFGDLDLYFYDKHDDADRIADRELKATVTNHAHHHSKYSYRGITVESHYDFVNRHYPPSNRRYESMLKKLVANSQLPTFEVLFLLRHMAGHFASSRITLRDLVDWYLTCRTLQDTVDWNTVQGAVKRYGMTRFARALCSIVEHRFGYRVPLAFDGGPDATEERDRVERDIVYGSAASVDQGQDGLLRLNWKLRRHRSTGWKRRMVFSDPPLILLFSNLTSHAGKPHSILHKM